MHDFRQTKFFGLGVRYDIYRGSYTDVRDKPFTKSIPLKTTLPMAFAFFEYPFGRTSPWNLNAFAGFQLSTNQLANREMSQDIPGFYTYFVFRVGIAYQLHARK